MHLSTNKMPAASGASGATLGAVRPEASAMRFCCLPISGKTSPRSRVNTTVTTTTTTTTTTTAAATTTTNNNKTNHDHNIEFNEL